MRTATTELTERVDELLEVLRKDVEHLEQSVEWLDKLRALAIKRDDSALSDLLERIRLQSLQYTENQKLRERVRGQIAAVLDWPVEQVRLGRLREVLPERYGSQVAQMRDRLIKAVGRLRSEHAGTSELLADLARFNGMMLNWILEAGQGRGVTYDARGGRSRSGDVALVNLQF